jgi:hypothetical protein
MTQSQTEKKSGDLAEVLAASKGEKVRRTAAPWERELRKLAKVFGTVEVSLSLAPGEGVFATDMYSAVWHTDSAVVEAVAEFLRETCGGASSALVKLRKTGGVPATALRDQHSIGAELCRRVFPETWLDRGDVVTHWETVPESVSAAFPSGQVLAVTAGGVSSLLDARRVEALAGLPGVVGWYVRGELLPVTVVTETADSYHLAAVLMPCRR